MNNIIESMYRILVLLAAAGREIVKSAVFVWFLLNKYEFSYKTLEKFDSWIEKRFSFFLFGTMNTFQLVKLFS